MSADLDFADACSTHPVSGRAPRSMLLAGASALALAMLLPMQAGAVVVGNVNANSNPTVLQFQGGTLNGNASITVAGLNTVDSNGGTINFAGNNRTITFSNTTNALGNVGTPGALTISGGGNNNRLVISGPTTFSGGFIVSGNAQLALTGVAGPPAVNGSIANSGVTLNNTASFSVAGTSAGTTSNIVSLTSASSTTNVITGANRNLGITGSATTTYAGNISGGGGFIVGGSTNLTLTGATSMTGPVSIASSATLALSGNGSISNASRVIVDGKLDLTNASAPKITTLTSGPNSSGEVTLGSNTLGITAATMASGTGYTGIYSGIISGTGGLTIESNGASKGGQLLAGVNTYQGLTTVKLNGTLGLYGNGSIAQSSGLKLEGGTFTLAMAGADATIKTLNGTGSVILGMDGNVRSLTITGGGNYTGSITGPGGLTIAGGTQTLSGMNSFTGLTTVKNGAELILNAMLMDSAKVEAGGLLRGDAIIEGSLTNDGTVKVDGGGLPLNLQEHVMTVGGDYISSNGSSLVMSIINPQSQIYANTDPSLLAVAGNATLGGTLRLDFLDFMAGFVPSIGDIYPLISATNYLGDFTSFFTSLDGGACSVYSGTPNVASSPGNDNFNQVWKCRDGATNDFFFLAELLDPNGHFAVQVVNPVGDIPEPVGLGLFGAGLLGLGWARRRRAAA